MFIDMFGFRYGYNLVWTGVFIISILLAYDTHAISALFGLGVLMFILTTAVVRKRIDLLFILAGLILTGLAEIYFKYGTLDLYAVFQTVSPPWGSESPNLLYYPILLVRNFPGIFVISPLIVWSVYRHRRTSDIYLLVIFLSFLAFISLQTAQNERYLTPILPTLLILTVISMAKVMDNTKAKAQALFRYTGVLIVLIISLPHLYLFAKELNEIDTYTPTSISIHKKFDFNSLFEYLEEQGIEDTTLIADEHSAYTLYQKGYIPDLIIVRDNDAIPSNEIINGEVTDIYFNIPFISYKEDLDAYLRENPGESIILILRNYEDFSGVEKFFEKVGEFDKPRIYRNY
jgi:hypothetical protein